MRSRWRRWDRSSFKLDPKSRVLPFVCVFVCFFYILNVWHPGFYVNGNINIQDWCRIFKTDANIWWFKKIQYSDIIPNFSLFSLDTKTQKDFPKICYIYLFICLHTAHCVCPSKQVHCQQGNWECPLVDELCNINTLPSLLYSFKIYLLAIINLKKISVC